MELFTLTFDPEPSGGFRHGYWYAKSAAGFDGVGDTPESAMGALIVQMTKYMVKREKEE